MNSSASDCAKRHLTAPNETHRPVHMRKDFIQQRFRRKTKEEEASLCIWFRCRNDFKNPKNRRNHENIRVYSAGCQCEVQSVGIDRLATDAVRSICIFCVGGTQSLSNPCRNHP
ncbi:unnamed protein product [Heligmosomoides polygyrus]|uniref:Uncharacterized protein n=1 Tax=Heligmosomoides polygyrus TaxID=6339 RepID=A0A3P8EQM5_HELPZ|nr:unnamed protein product [Heligmosomoides polygyrus]